MARTLGAFLVCAMIAASAVGGGRELSDRVVGLSPDVVGDPLVATNGTNGLIVWRTSAGIVGSFLTKSGQRIGTVFTITNLPIPQAIISVGSDYVLFAGPVNLYAITISGDGTRIGTPKVVVSSAGSARAVANGDRILVAYSTSNRPGPICIVVDRNGDPLSEPQALGLGDVASVARRDTGFVALVVDHSQHFVLSRISSDGNVALEASLDLPGNYPLASLAVAASATNPDDTLIVGVDASPLGAAFWSLRATLVHDGKVGQTWPIGPAVYGSGIAVVPSGDQFLVITGAIGPAYSTSAVAYRIASDGQAAAGPLTLMPNIQSVTVAFDKGWAMVAANRSLVFRRCIVGETIDIGSLTATSTEQVVSNGIGLQQAASVASDGVGYVAAWLETTADWQVLKATRIARTGEPLDGPGIELDRSDEVQALGVGLGRPYSFSAPALASQSAMTLVVWNQAKGIVAKRIDARGVVLDSQPIVIRPGIVYAITEPDVVSSESHADVKWNGSAFLVVWNEGQDVIGTTVDPSGFAASPRKIASPPSGEGFLTYDNPRLACNGQQCLLVVHEKMNLGASTQARVILVNSDGSGADLAHDRIEVEDLMATAAPAAVDGGFVVVSNSGRGTNVTSLTATRISAGPPTRVADTTTVFRGMTGGTISSNGKECVVSWSDTNTLGAAVLDGSVVRQRSGTSAKGGAPSVAVNASGEALIVRTERDDLTADGPTAIDRVVGYEVRDFTPLPDPPPAPVDVRAFGSGFDYVVTWSEEPPTAFVVEALYYPGGWTVVTPLTPSGIETHASFHIPAPVAFRVSAINAGGISEPSAAASPIAQGPSRRRAGR